MQKSFKERVKEETITNSRLFKDFFVDYEYLICSDVFEKNPYYIIGAHVSNYKHLIGVSSEISAEEFFNKSINGELKEEDFIKSKIKCTFAVGKNECTLGFTS